MSPSVRLALLLCVVLPLSLIPLGLDVWAVDSFVQQARAAHRPRVMGTITQSTVTTSRGNKGTTSHHFLVRYTYVVEGRGYEGTRVRYILSHGDPASMRNLEGRFPRGSRTEVFYHPEDPSDAILQPGLRGADFLLLMPLGVLHLLVAALAFLVLREPAKVQSFEREGRTHVTLVAISPPAVGLMTLAGALMAGLLAWTMGAEPSVAGALLLWLVSFALGAAAMRAQHFWLSLGTRDLIVDARTRTLSLPALLGRSQRLDVPWSQVVAITVETRELGAGKKAHGLVLELRLSAGMSRREVLCELQPPDKVHALADWLRSRLHLPERPGPVTSVPPARVADSLASNASTKRR
jgi:hypothetical protein